MSSAVAVQQELVSADSHVIERVELWKDVVPPSFWPDDGRVYQGRPGGSDPHARLAEMAEDGVTREVLYPSLGLNLFALEDPATQEAAFSLYNTWLAGYCAAQPDRLLGAAMIAAYDAERAVAEIRRSVAAGLRGIILWQSPHPDLPLSAEHYDPIWRAAAEARLPVSFHILTGFDYSREIHAHRAELAPLEIYRGAVARKLSSAVECLFQLVFGGVFERHPDLHAVLVENEVGWLPFVLDQWDYYWGRLATTRPVPISRRPSEYFRSNVHVTFFRDPIVGRLLEWWGAESCMWSNDYPHRNSTWPRSREHVENTLGHLPEELRRRVTRGNCEGLYRLGAGAPS